MLELVMGLGAWTLLSLMATGLYAAFRVRCRQMIQRERMCRQAGTGAWDTERHLEVRPQ